MNNMQIFKYENNDVRTVEMNGEPWFVLKDVCGVLGITDHKVAARRLEQDEECQIKFIRKVPLTLASMFNASAITSLRFTDKFSRTLT